MRLCHQTELICKYCMQLEELKTVSSGGVELKFKGHTVVISSQVRKIISPRGFKKDN